MTEQLVFPLLSKGAHKGPKDGACIMEAVSWLAGEEWSDTPECVDYELAGLAQMINDVMVDELRPLLLNHINQFIGTADLPVKLTDIIKDMEDINETDDVYPILNAWFQCTNLVNTRHNEVLCKWFDGEITSAERDAAKYELSKEYLIALDNLLTEIEVANAVTPEPVRVDQVEAIKELVG